MKSVSFGKALLSTIVAIMVSCGAFAQNKPVVKDEVLKMVGRFENAEGVESHVFVKGEGLDLVKMALRKEFGKEFLKGMTTIAVIDYTQASAGTCESIRKSLDTFVVDLEEIDLRKTMKEESEGYTYMRCYADIKDETGNFSNFVILIEDKEQKFFMFMGGDVSVEK